MTRSRDIKGRKISREEALKELGDPSTWEKDARELARKQEEPYKEARPLKKTSKSN